MANPNKARLGRRRYRFFPRRLKIIKEPGLAIGRSSVNGLWYGWSHRAYHGFKTRAEAVRFAKSVA